MKKATIYLVLILFVSFIVAGIYQYVFYKRKLHNVIYKIPINIINLIKKEERNKINYNFSYSEVSSNDVLANFNYNGYYHFAILDWKKKSKHIFSKDKIRIASSILFRTPSGQTLNAETNREIRIRDLKTLDDAKCLLIEKNSKINYFINQSNLVGVIGDLTQVSITDNYNVERIRISAPKYYPNMFIGVLLKNGRSYLVMIESKKKITPDILQIFE